MKLSLEMYLLKAATLVLLQHSLLKKYFVSFYFGFEVWSCSPAQVANKPLYSLDILALIARLRLSFQNTRTPGVRHHTHLLTQINTVQFQLTF